jgi:pseudouridylate synthase
MVGFDIQISEEVKEALSGGKGVVALESTIIAHGLPRSVNLQTALEIEEEVRRAGAVPATIAVVDGCPTVGLSRARLEKIAASDGVMKLGTRELAYAVSERKTGATTVSATMFLAHKAGISLFATGGIGGVHIGAADSWDVSSDLIELSRTPVAVVCAGAKSILDLPKTLEYLETMCVPVLGYCTDEFPAFYSRTSGLKLESSLQTPLDFSRFLSVRHEGGFREGVVVANPISPSEEIPLDEMEGYIRIALDECRQLQVKGKAVTPFVLSRLPELTQGRSLRANVALVKSNARLAGLIAVESGV